MNVRQMWAAKLAGGNVLQPATSSRAPSAVPAPRLTLNRPPFAGLVLGIDPSLRGTGLALIEFAPGRQPVLLRCDTVKVHQKVAMPYALA